MLYQAHPAAPTPLGSHSSEGWWGWFDQEQYLKITSQFLPVIGSTVTNVSSLSGHPIINTVLGH